MTKTLKWPLQGRACITLLNQFEIGYHAPAHFDFSSLNLTPGKTYSCEKVITLLEISKIQERIVYLKNDTLFFEVSVDFPSNPPWLKCGITMTNTIKQMCKQLAYKEPQVFKVTNFFLLKNNSTPYDCRMRTNYQGYIFNIEINCDGSGSGTGTHVSVSALIESGHYDEILSWPFIGTLKIELLNQLADDYHHSNFLTF